MSPAFPAPALERMEVVEPMTELEARQALAPLANGVAQVRFEVVLKAMQRAYNLQAKKVNSAQKLLEATGNPNRISGIKLNVRFCRETDADVTLPNPGAIITFDLKGKVVNSVDAKFGSASWRGVSYAYAEWVYTK